MEFYINHLTAMEGCDANNIATALMSDAGVEDPSSTQNVVYRPPFPLLETIAEETMEDLMLDLSDSSSASALDESSESPSSNSGRWGWGWGWLNTSDDDSSSVIHVPVSGGSPAAIPSGSLVHHHSELTDINSGKLAPIWRLLLPLVCFFNGFPVNRNLSSGWTRFGLWFVQWRRRRFRRRRRGMERKRPRSSQEEATDRHVTGWARRTIVNIIAQSVRDGKFNPIWSAGKGAGRGSMRGACHFQD